MSVVNRKNEVARRQVARQARLPRERLLEAARDE